MIATMKINTKGLGQFAYAPEAEDVEYIAVFDIEE